MMKKIDNLIVFIREKSFDYVYSFFLPFLASCLVLLFWVANWQLVGFSVMILFCCFVLIFHDDFLPIIPLLLLLPMCFRDSTGSFDKELTFLIILFSLVAVSLVFHLIKYPMKNIKLDGLFFVLVAINLVFIICGLFSNNIDNIFGATDIYLISGIMPLVLHFFFYNKIDLNKKVNIRKYLCYAFIFSITVACVQLCLAKYYDFTYGRGTWKPAIPFFSWANTNTIGNLILLAVPLCCYMALSSKHAWAWMIEVLFFYCSMFVSGSDGALAALLAISPFLMFYVYKNCYKDNLCFIKNFFMAVLSCIMLAVAILVLFDIADLISAISTSSSGNGRLKAYNIAIDIFFEYPIIGLGLGGGKVALDTIAGFNAFYGFYHSTFFHILACCGIVGIVAYIVYYIIRFRYILAKDSVFGKAILYAFVMFAIYGMIDTSEFNIVLMFMTILITITGLLNKNGSDDKPLPLFVKNLKF